MVFHENRLLAEDSYEISYLIFFETVNLSSAAVVIGALRVKHIILHLILTIYQLVILQAFLSSTDYFLNFFENFFHEHYTDILLGLILVQTVYNCYQ